MQIPRSRKSFFAVGLMRFRRSQECIVFNATKEQILRTFGYDTMVDSMGETGYLQLADESVLCYFIIRVGVNFNTKMNTLDYKSVPGLSKCALA